MSDSEVEVFGDGGSIEIFPSGKSIERLPDGETIERYPDGRVLRKGDDNRIKSSALPSSVAAEMGRISNAKRNSIDESVDSLLAELGLTSQADKHLAEILVRGGNAGVQAAKTLLARSRNDAPESVSYAERGYYKPPAKGERCDLCGQYNHLPAGWVEIFEQLLTMIPGDPDTAQPAWSRYGSKRGSKNAEGESGG